MQVWPQPPPLEKVVQRHIVCDLERLGFHVTNFSQARPSNQTRGIPDLLAMHPSWHLALFIEVKAAKGRVSPAQEAWHDVARRSGVTVVVARGTSDVLAALVALGAPIQVQGA